MAGHPGVAKTKELVLREYWWPKMKRDVEEYMHACETCQHTKASTQAKRAPLHPNEISDCPWTHISVDMVTGLPKCQGYDAILIIVDRFSKEIIPVRCSTELSSEGWAKILCNQVYAKHGMPQVVISDRGPQFISNFLKDLYKLLNIKSNTSMAFHPQTDGQTEQVNQEVEKYLQIFINHRQTDWVEWLALAAFQHNNQVHSATGKSPFQVNHERNPDIMPGAKRSALFRTLASENFADTMTHIHEETKAALEKATEQMKKQYDKKSPSVNYKVSNKVWLDTTNLKLAYPKKKLDNKQTRPFEITAKKGASSHTLKHPAPWCIHLTFNEVLLTPYVPPMFPNQEQPPPPPPDLIDNQEAYEVKKVLNSRLQKKPGHNPKKEMVTDYFVKWKGYGPESNSWVREDQMDADKLIEEFLTKHVD